MDINDRSNMKEEQKKLYEEYKIKLAELKKVEKENQSVGQVFTKGLLPIYILFILSLGPTNGNEISHKIGEKTNGLWVPSTGGIYPILNKLEKNGLVVGNWSNPEKRVQKIYTLTELGFIEFDHKKLLLKGKIQEALNVFNTIYCDLYDE